MSETKFTPGPWHLGVDEAGRYRKRDMDWHDICCVESDNFDAIDIYASDYSDDPLPNARLIAAAPAMYAACKATAEWLSSFSMPPTSTLREKEAAMSILEAALALADGETT